ncbi:thiamine pyrophosphate-dependent enzyme [Actinopolymorpha sp. B17G11]|uniref:thiamine pyrophosphate-dependent enzyme n=1 Tax=Actinopolymorpha sp. B17G11 TaxID=3160861 RepID=UPI0032E3A752
MHEDPALDDAVRVDLLRTMVLLRTFHDAIRREADARRATTAAVQVPSRAREWQSGTGGRTDVAERAGAGGRADADGPVRRNGVRSSLLGCEPMAAGFGVHLNSDDSVTAPRQPHYLAIARGIDLRCVVGEAIGTAHGHQSPEESEGGVPWSVLGLRTSGPSAEGAGYLPALGRAFGYQEQGSHRVAVAIVDQATSTEEGFRSATQLAHLWKLPVVFLLCTDRLAAASESTGDLAAGHVHDYGIPSVCVTSVAVESACAAAGRAVRRARAGEGPFLVEVQTMWAGPPEAATPGAGAVQDPVTTYEQALRERGLVDDALMAQIHAEATYRVNDAVRDVVDSHREGPDSCALCARKAAS